MGLDAAVEDARTKLARAEALAVRQLISQSDLDLARIAMGEASAARQAGQSAILEARAALDQAKAALDQANDNLKHTAVASPIDGIVVARNVDVGQTVASTFQAPVLFNVATDLTHMQVEVDIDESDIGGVKEGEPATFQVESYADQTFRGTVLGVRLQPVAAPAATPAAPGTSAPAAAASDVSAAVSYATIIDVSNPGEKLRPGMTATVTLDGSRLDHAVRIPNTALSFRPPPEVLGATGQRVTTASTTGTSPDTDRRQVWRYDGTEFTPVDVRVGLADGQWTQLVRGSP
jgi:HlyD family secretion protein